MIGRTVGHACNDDLGVITVDHGVSVEKRPQPQALVLSHPIPEVEEVLMVSWDGVHPISRPQSSDWFHVKSAVFDTAVDEITRDDDQIRIKTVCPRNDGLRPPDRK
jgi:hypothetical protein